MPMETAQAVELALQQEGVVIDGQMNHHALVDHVRDYFNEHSIQYETFSAADLEPYLPE